VPREYAAAAAKFSADTLLAYGDSPWNIERVFAKLVEAMRVKDTLAIVQLSADLGHYVADLHVPLHTTLNYDGQFTGNRGIHGRFEAMMIERFADRYAFVPGQIDSIANATLQAFDIVLESYPWVDSTLHADSHARTPGKIYQAREDFDEDYYQKLQAALGQIGEKRMNAAAARVASFWYTAWLRAGRPAL
jgi:hypothetical protein